MPCPAEHAGGRCSATPPVIAADYTTDIYIPQQSMVGVTMRAFRHTNRCCQAVRAGPDSPPSRGMTDSRDYILNPLPPPNCLASAQRTGMPLPAPIGPVVTRCPAEGPGTPVPAATPPLPTTVVGMPPPTAMVGGPAGAAAGWVTIRVSPAVLSVTVRRSGSYPGSGGFSRL